MLFNDQVHTDKDTSKESAQSSNITTTLLEHESYNV